MCLDRDEWLGPKWPGVRSRCCYLTERRCRTPGEQAEPNPPKSGTRTKRGKPIRLPLGKRAARDAHGRVGKGCWSKRRPVCNQRDRDCALGGQHHLTRKRADFQPVSRHEKACQTTKAGKQMTAGFGPAGALAEGNIGWQQVCIVKFSTSSGR